MRTETFTHSGMPTPMPALTRRSLAKAGAPPVARRSRRTRPAGSSGDLLRTPGFESGSLTLLHDNPDFLFRQSAQLIRQLVNLLVRRRDLAPLSRVLVRHSLFTIRHSSDGGLVRRGAGFERGKRPRDLHSGLSPFHNPQGPCARSEGPGNGRQEVDARWKPCANPVAIADRDLAA